MDVSAQTLVLRAWADLVSSPLNFPLDFVIRNEPSLGMRMGCGCRNLGNDQLCLPALLLDSLWVRFIN